MNKKILSIFLIILFAVICFPLIVDAASGTIDTDGTYDIGAFGNDSTITIDSLASTDGLTVTLTNTSGTTYTNLRINCVDAGTKLTINGVKIDNSATSGAYALAFDGAGNTLTLVGDSSLISGSGEPGVRVEAGTALTISGGGTLSATGGNYAAGIGARRYSDSVASTVSSGAITISGGTITANGGSGGAGIGGGEGEVTTVKDHVINTAGGNCGEITITGGTVTANSGTKAAGIGAGCYGSSGEITIEGGSVTATGLGGAGIGGGYREAYVWGDGGIVMAGSGNGGVITVSGGEITASSSYSDSVMGPGAGIGGGFSGESGTITISGGVITASSDPAGGASWGSAGIGGGAWNDGVVITIEGGDITANGDTGGAGIGGGSKFNMSGFYLVNGGTGAGGAITIEGGRVVATGGEFGAGIGGGGDPNRGVGGSGGTIVISDAVVYAEGDASENAYDIGSGNNGTEGTLTIAGTASVFLRNDSCLPPTLPVPHIHKTPTDAIDPMEVVFGTIYGIEGTGESPWTSATGGYFLPLYHIVYDANGGKGKVTNSAQIPGSTATVKTGGGIWQTGHMFTHWNTAANDTGTIYPALSSLQLTSPSITLYAQWVSVPPTGDPTASYLHVFSALALLSIAGIVVMIYTKSKQRSR